MAFLKNTSKYRYCKLKENKEIYNDLRISTEGTSLSNSIAASANWVAIPHETKGNVHVFPLSLSEFKREANPPLISAHGGEVCDLAFNPFDHDMLATGGGDGFVKLWKVPAGGLTESLSGGDAVVKIGDSANAIAFHKSASHLLGVGAKNGLHTVDLNKASVVRSFPVSGFGKDIQSVDWSYDGKLVCGVGKNYAIHVFDPRVAEENALAATAIDNNFRAARGLFLGSKGELLVMGTDKSRNTMVQFYDSRDMSKPIKSAKPQFSTGRLVPMYDLNTNLLFLTVKGSSMLAVYDMTNPTGDFAPINNHTSVKQGPYNGACLIPPQACNLYECEITRVLKATTGFVEPIMVNVPRKDKGYHDDLYEPTLSAPAMTSEEWFGGKDAPPRRANIKTLTDSWMSPDEVRDAQRTAASGSTAGAGGAPATASNAATRQSSAGSVSDVKIEEKVEKVVYVPTSTRKHLDQVMARSAFANTRAREVPSKHNYYFDLKQDVKHVMQLGKNVVINPRMFALPWTSIGGSGVAAIPNKRIGRNNDPPLIRGHKQQINCLNVSLLNLDLLATGGQGAHLLVTKVPDEQKETILKPDLDLLCSGKVTTVDFHENIANLLISSSVGFDGSSVRLWDINQGKEALHLQVHKESVVDIAPEHDGKFIFTTSKDNVCRQIDPRAGKVVAEWQPPEHRRDTQIKLGNDNTLLTIGFGARASRTMSLWDTKDFSKPLHTLEIDNDNGVMIPHYDPDTQLLYMGTVGSRIVRLFQVTDEKKFKVLGAHTASGNLTGFAMLPKMSCDVKKAEVAKGVFLMTDRVIPVAFSVPRKRLEFFQDDLYPDTRVIEPIMTVEEYIGGKNADVQYRSLAPAGMTPLSEAPAEEMTQAQLKYKKQLIEQAKEAPKGALGTSEDAKKHFEKIAQVGAGKRNRFDAEVEAGDEIDDDEWDD